MQDLVAVFDGHNDTLLKLEIAARRGTPRDFLTGAETLDIDLPRARTAGFAGGLFAMFTPSRVARLDTPYNPGDPDNYASIDQPAALAFTLAMFSRLHRLVREAPDDLALCTDTGAIRRAMAEDRVAIVAHIEGAECLDTDGHALEVLHAAGLRSLGLVWSRANAFGDGAPMGRQDPLLPGRGLSDAGRALVADCARLGIMIDLSHLTEAGFWDVARVYDGPLVASHSNAHAISPTARNLSDRQLHAIAESGGLAGLNFNASFLRPDNRDDRDVPMAVLLRHLDHMIGILGEDGVALGSDFDGCALPLDIGDVTGLPRLVAAMRQAGYGEPLIAKIARDNWLRVLGRVID